MIKKLLIRHRFLAFASALLFAVAFSGCEAITGEAKYEIIVIDGCEYLHKTNGYQSGESFSHKGNCKFCTERNKKQTEE
jgi:hypothetical protein